MKTLRRTVPLLALAALAAAGCMLTSGQFVATLTRNSAMLSLSADMGTSGHFDCKTHMDADVDVLLGPCQVRATGPLLAKLRNLGAPLVRH